MTSATPKVYEPRQSWVRVPESIINDLKGIDATLPRLRVSLLTCWSIFGPVDTWDNVKSNDAIFGDPFSRTTFHFLSPPLPTPNRPGSGAAEPRSSV